MLRVAGHGITQLYVRFCTVNTSIKWKLKLHLIIAPSAIPYVCKETSVDSHISQIGRQKQALLKNNGAALVLF